MCVCNGKAEHKNKMRNFHAALAFMKHYPKQYNDDLKRTLGVSKGLFTEQQVVPTILSMAEGERNPLNGRGGAERSGAERSGAERSGTQRSGAERSEAELQPTSTLFPTQPSTAKRPQGVAMVTAERADGGAELERSWSGVEGRGAEWSGRSGERGRKGRGAERSGEERRGTERS